MKPRSLLTIMLAVPTLAQDLTAEIIESMGNNSLFTRWRPYSHISAPSGWMNDPCGPVYDPVEDTYYIGYQYHPNHYGWGDIGWGLASSKDLIDWTDVDTSPDDDLRAWQNNQAEAIRTTNLTSDYMNPRYNALGIWSGTTQPVDYEGNQNGTLLAFYTSISYLPLSWDKPYPIGSESQSLAISTDGGVTWENYENNPVIRSPPDGWNVTGFRDPFYEQIPELDALLGFEEGSNFYMALSSGINGSGPRIPMYIAPANDLTNWTFLGALDDPAENVTLGDPRQLGYTGSNWEVCNFFTLNGRWFQSGGIQGGSSSFISFWNEGNVSVRANGSVQFDVISGGPVDAGGLYAITSFNDTKNNRRIQIGWSPEATIGNFAMRQQGFQGALSLPKRLFSMETEGVNPPSNLSQIQNSVYEQADDGTWTARTLGSTALEEVVEGLRNGSEHVKLKKRTCVGVEKTADMIANMSSSYEVSLEINSTTGRTGVVIAASPGFEEYTTIWFDPETFTIACNRTHSSVIEGVLNTTYEGYFEPYNLSSTNEYEAVHMRIWVDGSLVEVCVNDRFWMTSRIYPGREDSVGFGVFADEGVRVNYNAIEYWDGLHNIYPDRPLNSSSLLIFDTVAETNNYTWWDGF